LDLTVEEIFTKLRSLKVFDFYKSRALSPEQLIWLLSLCNLYIVGSSEERRRISALVDSKISFLFLMCAKAMAIEAVQARDEGKIVLGLVALTIENGASDWRDSLSVLVILYNSALKIEASPDSLFRKVAEISSPQAANFFLSFLARPPESRHIAKFGFKEGTDSKGMFTYVPL